jgi:magnesium-transporting ATPase (P-type)
VSSNPAAASRSTAWSLLGPRDLSYSEATRILGERISTTSSVVVTTGANTEIGNIQRLIGEAKPPETPMQKQLREASKFLRHADIGVKFRPRLQA